MRFAHLALFTCLAPLLSAEAVAQTLLPGAADTDRPGGVYISLRVVDAAACATACAADGICMAWTHRANGLCELKAIAPGPLHAPGVRSGLSARAPEFARRITLSASTAEPLPATETESAQASPEAAEAATPTAADYALLGGPIDDESAAWLRPRLGAAEVR